MKKVVCALLLASAMVMGLTETALAAITPMDKQSFTVALEGTTDKPTEGHTYNVYQIYTATLSTDDKDTEITADDETIFADVKYGTAKANTGAAVPSEELEAITNADTFANDFAATITSATTVYGTLDSSNGFRLTNVPAGYYLIVDATTNVPAGDSVSKYMVQVVGDVAITPKSGTVESEKKIIDTNDTTGETSNWQDSADYDIGDAIPFQLKGVVAENYADYKTYYFAFHDVESTGLTFNAASVKVYVNGAEIATGFSVVTNTTDGDTFDVVFSDLKKIASVGANSVITVEYTSTLNENAVIGSKGNPNTMYLEYSNKPNTEQKGKTVEDKVIAFTYKVDADKVTKDNKALTGAAFALYKQNKAGEWELVALQNATEDNGTYTIIDKTVTSFEWKGIDDGTYKIVEVITPDGYNTIDDQVFTVSATHTDGAEPALTALTGDPATGSVITLTPSVDEGSLKTAIINNKGIVLPSTGGAGTTLIYILGAVFVIAAGVILVAKRRSTSR